MSKPEFKFHYFPLRCRGEPTRLLFAYAKKDYVDERIPMESWPTMKSSMPMGQVPVLEIDGKMISQSTAIARLLANEFGIAGATKIEKAEADMLVDGVFDLWGSLRAVYVNILYDNLTAMKTEWATFNETNFVPFLDRYAAFLAKNNTGYFLTWADIVIAEFLSCMVDCFDKDCLKNHAQLNEFSDKILSLPGIKEYVEKRPETKF